ncbi:MAG TPA: hypothetical protein VE090_03625 [Methylomirabilota bacterium]|nr:hypothetical protein [Methylomirabilota bacterium]
MHLKIGEIIWKTHQVPNVNLFSYTNPVFPFINHHWLFEVWVYVSSISIGFEALLVIKIILLLISATVILVLAKKTKSALLFPISFIFFHLLRERIELRPEIFSFLFTVITLYILEMYEKKNSKLIYFLPIISLLWVNTHIYFPVGIFLQLVFIGDLLFRKYIYKQNVKNKLIPLTWILGASVLCLFINPNFITGALYPFIVFNNYGVTITENQTIFTLQNIHFVNPDFLFFYLSAFIVFGSIYTSIWRTKFSFKNIGLSLLGLALAVQSIRGFPYLALISLPYVLLNCNYTISNIWTKTINICFALLLVGEAIFYLNGSYYGLTYQQATPSLSFTANEKPAVDFLLQHHLPQPIFNNFDTGSYLIYRTYPEYKVFIDERPEAYPASFFTNTYVPIQEDYPKFKKETKKLGVKTVFFTISDENPRAIKFLNALTSDSQWKIVYLDYYSMILVKNDVQKQLGLKTIDLSKIKVNDFYYTNVVPYSGLSIFFFNMHQLEIAKKFAEKALALNPNNPAANKAMAYILYFENPRDYRIHDYLSNTENGVFW